MKKQRERKTQHLSEHKTIVYEIVFYLNLCVLEHQAQWVCFIPV